MSRAFFVIDRYSISWRSRSFLISSVGSHPTSPCASGSPDAARARRHTPSPCCSAKRSARQRAMSNFRSSPPISIWMRSPAPARASTGKDRSGSLAGAACRSFRGKTAAIASPELRAAIVFTPQDVLADPPFSRMDMISCRNLLIYLRPEAQAKALSAFHFALREGGILLLGSSESVDNSGPLRGAFQAGPMFRHVGRSRPANSAFVERRGGKNVPARPGQSRWPRSGRSRRILSTAGPGGIRSGGGADQQQARMPLFPRTD